MVKPKQNFVITGFFNWYIGWIIGRNFKSVTFNQPAFDAEKSILLIANHCSWWDGFLLYHLNQAYLKKKFHAMVLEESMRKISFFKYLGGFSVAKNSREMLESLDYAAGLLNDPGNMVVIFPQGKLYSNFVDEVNFEKGAAHIAARAKNGFQYVLVAGFTENFQYKKSSANMYLKVLNVDEVDDLAKVYQQHYQTSKQQQTSIII